ncbi:MAG TPA: hypothetical protein DF364_00105 [Ruminococcaceae bacterium]|nr:hypothetical protein [Oscillospiraceae bacterium]
MLREEQKTVGDFVPLYRQVSQRIFRKIQQGVYKYGDKIPSEKELSAHYGVNRMTVRRAIALLADQGILKSVQGKGVFVVDTFYQVHLPQTGALFDYSFFHDSRLRQEILFLQKVLAGKTFAELFQIGTGASVWMLGRRWMAENMAAALEYTYFPVEWIPDFSEESCKISWEQIFASHGMHPIRLEQTVLGIRIYGEEAQLLQLQEGSGSFLINQQMTGEGHRVLRYSKILAQSQKITYYLKEPVSR